MKITFSPVRRDDRPSLERRGDALVIDGLAFDFTDLPEGALLPAEAVGSDLITGPVTREGGELRLELLLTHGANAPTETLFPAPLLVAGDGPIPLPPHDAPADPEEVPQ